jgi:hypothetical protein
VDALYVYDGGSVADAAEAVGRAIGLPLELHDSSYYGGDYYRVERALDQVIVLENYVEDDGEPSCRALRSGRSAFAHSASATRSLDSNASQICAEPASSRRCCSEANAALPLAGDARAEA